MFVGNHHKVTHFFFVHEEIFYASPNEGIALGLEVGTIPKHLRTHVLDADVNVFGVILWNEILA